MVLVGNEDEDTTCEDEDRANANGKYFLCLSRKVSTFNMVGVYICYGYAYINYLLTVF